MHHIPERPAKKRKGGRPRGSFAPPTYQRHCTGQARTRIGGRDLYLGKYGSPESYRRFGELCAGYQAGLERAANAPVSLAPGSAFEAGIAAGTADPVESIPVPAIEPARPVKSIANAIDPKTDLITFKEAAQLPWLPRRISEHTIRSWHARGVRGVHLETLSVGGRLYTSESALLIFFSNCALIQSGQPVTAPPGVAETVGAKLAQQSAKARLKTYGIDSDAWRDRAASE